MKVRISMTAARRMVQLACGAAALTLGVLAPAPAATGAAPINVAPGTYDAYRLGGQDLPPIGAREITYNRRTRNLQLTVQDDQGTVGPVTMVLFYVCVTADGRHWNEYHVYMPAPAGQRRVRLDVAIGYDHPGDSYGYDVFTRETGTQRWTTAEYWQPRQ